jgi:para-aminobenzoate synthetase component 1
MVFIGKSEIIDKINDFGTKGEPFVFAVDFDGLNGFVMTLPETTDHGVLFNFGGKKNYPLHLLDNHKISRGEKFNNDKHPGSGGDPAKEVQPSGLANTTLTRYPIDFSFYQQAFNNVHYHLRRGDTYLLNLTFPTPFSVGLSPETIFRHSRARFKLYVPGSFMVFSPEIFVRIQQGLIHSHPMKGTIDASLPRARELLRANLKERYEHNTIVDLIRNDLSMVASQVKVRRFRYLELIKTNRGDLWQMSSEITGKLAPDYRSNLGNLLFNLLPAGSVTGAPKERTVQIIRETERYERGFYTGIFGYFNRESLQTAVAIRFVELDPARCSDIMENFAGIIPGLPDSDEPIRYIFKSGGGITALSNPEEEYREMVSKVYLPLQ